jgi:hypothetical protein
VALAERSGPPELIVDHVSLVDAVNSAGTNPTAKVMSLVAGISRRWNASPLEASDRGGHKSDADRAAAGVDDPLPVQHRAVSDREGVQPIQAVSHDA